jgi:hypothetical protein
MTSRMRCLSGWVAVSLLLGGCAAQVPRYVISPAKGQTAQQMDSDKFDKALTEGALVGLLVGGAAGAGLGAAAGAAGGIVGTGASVGAIAGGGTGATLGGSYLYDKGLNQTQRAYYACLETRGYTLTK